MASTWQKTPGILQLEKLEIQGQTRGHWSTPHFQSPLSSPRSSLGWHWGPPACGSRGGWSCGLCWSPGLGDIIQIRVLRGYGHSVLANYRHLCQPVDYSRSELGMRIQFWRKLALGPALPWLCRFFCSLIAICVAKKALTPDPGWAGIQRVVGNALILGKALTAVPCAAQQMARVCWWFFSKVIELLDAVFLILRKKQEQVTFLHVYHHGSVLFSWWSGVKYVPGGQAFFIGMLNSFVHIFMYGYCALASLGPRMHRHVWWKRYLTILQLCQFVAIAAHSSYNLFIECLFPDGFNTTVFLYILALFLHFYCRTCVRGKQEKLT